jgi:hypothetical protein
MVVMDLWASSSSVQHEGLESELLPQAVPQPEPEPEPELSRQQPVAEEKARQIVKDGGEMIARQLGIKLCHTVGAVGREEAGGREEAMAGRR